MDARPIKRALVSVYDKTGIVELTRTLIVEFHVEVISTGGTAKALREAGLSVTDVSEVTGFPEMMEGRVKTLHPKVHGALLADRSKPEHLSQAEEHGIELIDLVVVNLYPFEQTVAKPGITDSEAIEQIDIGGPSMLRSAAKNHQAVTVVCEPDDYHLLLADMRRYHGSTSRAFRRELAGKVFRRTSAYDLAIHNHLDGTADAICNSEDVKA